MRDFVEQRTGFIEEDGKRIGVTVSLCYDQFPVNPRTEWDNAWSFAFYHGRYDLGDPDVMKEYPKAEHFAEWYEEVKDSGEYVFAPVYMYDHSGIGLSLSRDRYPFNCPWDSGMLGLAFISTKKIQDEWGDQHYTGENKYLKPDGLTPEQRAWKYLEGEIETYNQYLSGQVYCVIVEKICPCCGHGDGVVDSVGGIFHDDADKVLDEYARDYFPSVKFETESEVY